MACSALHTCITLERQENITYWNARYGSTEPIIETTAITKDKAKMPYIGKNV